MTVGRPDPGIMKHLKLKSKSDHCVKMTVKSNIPKKQGAQGNTNPPPTTWTFKRNDN